MSEKKSTLSQEDVKRLLEDTSGANRAETAAKIAGDFSAGRLGEKERSMAEEILRLMVKDAEVRVREALAQNLKENPSVPHDVAVALARDVESVSVPIISFSEALSDEDLVSIIQSHDTAKQVAVAGRTQVSESVSEALVETSNEEVVSTLVSNEGADISEPSLQKVVNDLGASETVQDAMVHRPKLPLTVTERLLTMVSEHMKEEIAKNQELPADLATDLILKSRERATITLSEGSGEDELIKLINQLHSRGRLTPSIILRALCMGDMNFFEASVACLVGLPITNVRVLLHDSGELGLEGIYKKSGLPTTHYPGIRAALDVAAETEYDGGENDRERYSRRMIERILTQYGDLGVDMESDDLEYLLDKMDKLPADSLNQAA